MSQNSTLQRGLNTRHIRFLALGSAIGTGLFYGSATAIKMAGPSVLLAYIRNTLTTNCPFGPKTF